MKFEPAEPARVPVPDRVAVPEIATVAELDRLPVPARAAVPDVATVADVDSVPVPDSDAEPAKDDPPVAGASPGWR